jgi:hypothetical protein
MVYQTLNKTYLTLSCCFEVFSLLNQVLKTRKLDEAKNKNGINVCNLLCFNRQSYVLKTE